MSDGVSLAEEDFDYILQYAKDDWVGLSVLVAEAGHVLGKGATNEQILEVMLSAISDLIDCGAVPGDLSEESPGFVAWAGSKEERISRIRNEVHRLGRLPYTGEVCWLHKPTG